MAGYSKTDFHRCTTFLLFLFCIWLVSLLWGCGGGTSEPVSSGSGSASFAIQWNTATDVQASVVIHQAIEDCETAGLASITCQVYEDESQSPIASGGPWDCADRQGRIEQIPTGSNRVFAVLGWSDAEGTGNIVYQGQIAGITINPKEIADVGTIDAYPFVPELSGPTDEEDVEINAFALAWNSVANAARYRVLVSDDSSFAAPLIDTQSSELSYRPLDLAPLTTYYWRVMALDIHGNEGVASATWQFTTTAVSNQVPTAKITVPETGTSYPLGQTVVFEGSGHDPDVGPLSGDSLVWTSDIDGRIGTGSSFRTPDLSAGTHTITLTVTDSAGATGSASIRIEITNVIDVNIDDDFEYVPEEFSLGRDIGESVAADWADRPTEDLEEPNYGDYHSQRYSYFTMGNSDDTTVSIVRDMDDEDNLYLFVDSNNNEDLRDDDGPIANQGGDDGDLFAAPVSLIIDVVTESGTIRRPYRLEFSLNDNYNVRFKPLCYYSGQLVIGDQSYMAVAIDAASAEGQSHNALYKEDGLYIDIDGDGILVLVEEELFMDGDQLSIGGTDYLLQLNYP